jgi:hypothetical protein
MTAEERRQHFLKIKGNCDYRLDVSPGIDHCEYHQDDCRQTLCPKMAHPVHGKHIHELALCQCPMCGEVNPDHKIDWDYRRPGFWVGFIGGTIGALTCLTAIFVMDYVGWVSVNMENLPWP